MPAIPPHEVLLAEDDPSDLKLTLHAFGKHFPSSTIHVVRDGAEALEFVFGTGRYAGRPAGLPRLVLLDLKLPLMNGIEVLRRIKTDARAGAVPVVVLSSSREDRDLAECYRLGANSYVVKPVDFAQLDELIHGLGFYWLVLNQPPPG